MRRKDEARPFGGLNVGLTGDMWQFPPVKATPFFHNPLKMKPVAAIQAISAMFWTKEKNSLNGFYELTVERRCKDPWLSHVLKGARHGQQDHETYCFLHGLPTRHPGSWSPEKGAVQCGDSACAELTAKWTLELLGGKHAHDWLRRRSEECNGCA